MTQKSPDFIDRFADGLANAATRMKAIENSPEYKQKRRSAYIEAACFGLVGLPVVLLSVMICVHFGWPRHFYFPIVMVVAIGGSRLAYRTFSR